MSAAPGATSGSQPNVKDSQGGGSGMTLLGWTVGALAGLAAWVWPGTPGSVSLEGVALPPQTVYVNPLSFAVHPPGAPFRGDGWVDHFNPTNTSPPFFQTFHPGFLKILGSNPSIRVIASNPGFAFAHEAPIWVPETDEVFFSSQDGGYLGFSDWDNNNEMGKLSLVDVNELAVASGSQTTPLNATVTPLSLPDTVQMTNGGTGPYHGSLLLVNSGRGVRPPSLALVNPAAPHNTTVILDNYFGRQFNSLNDAKIHPRDGKIYFTDVTYGWLVRFRPAPLLPNQVYRFDPKTGNVRVVADGFTRCNGLAFSADGKIAYIVDSGAAGGFLGKNTTDPATIYVYDVDLRSDALINRRVFAYVDAGVPDGVQVDTLGNVYAACGDGVHVWDRAGTLLGKFFTGVESANMVFAGRGRLVILAETVVYLAEIFADGVKLSWP
ncbi:D-lactonohydrolase-like protein [Fomitopsis serialis]|uniref:D-lactonohydrolase-like protein n=1 Tax=Fomitopsis serialis TaxID=139415 RepID=UPI0020077E86|nr:D-lactonohydrolase-like protein [Neoantrodia serialis]KAH9923811.1 D-lactonohydrolase-like protein [Neoantrodia serialis]